MNTQQKIALRNIFIKSWKNYEVGYAKLQDYIKEQAVKANIWDSTIKFTHANMDAAFKTMGPEYSNPKSRSRSMTVDFSDLDDLGTDTSVVYRGSDFDVDNTLEPDPDEYKTEQMESNGTAKW